MEEVLGQLSDENPMSDFSRSDLPHSHSTAHFYHTQNSKDKVVITYYAVPHTGMGELLVGKKCEAPAFAIARSGFELFRLCHSHYIMHCIRSCELS